MLKYIVFLMCVCACGQSPVAETKAVTNGKLVLGIVPLAGGGSEKTQRYRLLVCKKLDRYAAKDFADKSVCRSALLTKDGGEVDLVGRKSDVAHEKIEHLHSEFASAARFIDTLPGYEAHASGALAGLIVFGSLTLGGGAVAIAAAAAAGEAVAVFALGAPLVIGGALLLAYCC